MSCTCGYADECDGEWAVFYPLQDGGTCSVRPCNSQRKTDESFYLQKSDQEMFFSDGKGGS